jgi:hypothetical protein
MLAMIGIPPADEQEFQKWKSKYGIRRHIITF